MSLKCSPHIAPTGVPCLRPPTLLGPDRPRLPVMSVNYNRPDAEGNVDLPVPDEVVKQLTALTEKGTEIESRVTELENTGPRVEVVSPGEEAKEGQAADAKATHEALKELTTGKADKSAVDAVNKSVASVSAEAQRLAKESRAKGDLSVYSFEGGTTEYYLEDKFLPVTGASYYDFSKITFGAPPDGATNVIAAYDAKKINFAKFNKSTLKWASGDADVRFGGTKPAQVTLSYRVVGGEFKATEASLLTTNDVTGPDASAVKGQAADAEAVYKNFRLKNDLGYVISEVKTVPVWAFSLALGGEEFDTVDMTLQSSYVSDLGDDKEEWAGYSARGKYRCELLRSLGGIAGISTFSATIDGVPVTSTVYHGASAWENPFTFSGMTLRGSPLTASGTYSPAKQVEVVTAYDKIALEGTVKEELRKLQEGSLPMVETTHAELLTLRNSSQLVPGMQYRITDYVATTKQSNTKSANHPFDIIVTADSEDKLNEVARAIRHEDDIYFANCKLEAWKIWYCLDNDKSRFAWSTDSEEIDGVTVAGKGVIYRMIDERDNDVPYDFKGIKFLSPVHEDWQYTFGVDSDESCFYEYCCGNKMGSCRSTSAQELNFNLFRGGDCFNNIFGNDCYGNTFGIYCYSNTFGSGCYSNDIAHSCSDNTFESGCHSNIFESECYSNTFGVYCFSNIFESGCYNNILGPGCSGNTFGSECYDNSFGSECCDNLFLNLCTDNDFGNFCTDNDFEYYCHGNTFGNNCYQNFFGEYCVNNTLGNDCVENDFGYFCSGNTFGNECSYNTFGDYEGNILSYYQYITFGNGCKGLILYCTASTSGEHPYKNVELKSGVTGGVDEYGDIISRQTIFDDNVNQSFHTTYKPVGSMEVSV